MPDPAFTIEFWEDENGDVPVLRWLREDLSDTLRLAAGHAMNLVLQQQGISVCDSGWGKHVAPGIFEFRIDHDPQQVTDLRGGRSSAGASTKILLRILCHAHGNRLILLLGGYDKGADSSKRRQQREIEIAKKRLTSWRERN